jgi:hypothetical protein
MAKSDKTDRNFERNSASFQFISGFLFFKRPLWVKIVRVNDVHRGILWLLSSQEDGGWPDGQIE